MPTDPISTDSPFLHGAPPPWAARALAWLVIVVVVAAVVAAVTIHVPETVSSEFVLVPARGVDPVRAARTGRIVEVGAAEGALVAPGQTLFVIRSVTVGDQSAELAALETQLRGAVTARENALERYERQQRADAEQARGLAERGVHLVERVESHRALRLSRQTRYETSLQMAENEASSARSEVEYKREHVAVTRELARRYKAGYEANFLSWQEYMRTHVEAARIAVELEQLQRMLDIATLKSVQLRAELHTDETEWRIAMTQLETERDEVRAAAERLRHETDARATEFREMGRRLLEDVEKANIRTAAIRGALVGVRGNELSVSAPCEGTVVRLAVKRRDAVVQEGEVLCDVACSGERLHAELQVPPSGIGKIKRGQGVKLKYEAFPYERYGIRYATVQWVSSVGTVDRGAAAFRALASIEDQAVRVEGQPRPLLAGMGGRADVVVARRSLISYAFEPLRRLTENFAVAPSK